MGSYAIYGDKLIERGFAAVPIMPGTKKPGFFFAGMSIGLANWQKRFNDGPPAESERARWAAGDTGIGVIGGYRGLVAVDIDTVNETIRAALMELLPASAVRKAGQKGETLFYRGSGITSRSWDIDGRRVVDLIAAGRQTVLPPTIHPETGLPYRWTGSETLLDVEPEKLPELPADIANRITAGLEPFGYQPDPPPHVGNGTNGEDTPHRQLNDLALGNLAAWVPKLGLYRCRPARGGYEAVPIWRPSTTGREPEKRHRNLKISPLGIKDFGADEGYTPLDLVMTADGCDLDTAFRFLAERLGFSVEIDVSGLVSPAAPAADEDREEAGRRAGEGRPGDFGEGTLSGCTAPPVPAVDELERFTHVPGVVGDIVDRITGTARRPNRVLALGAAVTIVGTLIGRRVAGPTRSATHLYVVPVAGSGFGKQHVFDASRRLMRACKAEGHIGPSRFHSGSSIFQRLSVGPLMLCLQDEVGAVIRAVTDSKASSHERAVGELLRTLWGVSFGTLEAPAWADLKKSVAPVSCPAMSILGMSTPDEFLAALQGESVGNGLLNRFLVLRTTRRAEDTDPALDPFTVPRALADALHRLYLWSGPESLLHIADPEVQFVPDALLWASDRARACYMDFLRLLEQQADEHPETAVYVARCGEMAIRLATIRAAGRWGRGAAVDLFDMEWGVAIARLTGLETAAVMQDFLPRNDRSEMTAKIASYVHRKGPVKPRDIQMFLKGRLRSPEIKDILAQLVEAGEIEWTGHGYQPKTDHKHV
jgi:hypothetical protein